MASPWNQVPNWTSFENQGGGVAVVDLDGDGRPELIVLCVDHPTPGPNRAFYRVGKSLDGNGQVTGGWGNWIEIPNWGSVEDQGSGLAVADLDKDGRPELIVLHVEHQTPGPNRGQYRIGKALDAQGNVTGGWGEWIDVPGWNADADEGAALAIGDVDGGGSLDLVVFHIMDVTVPDPNRPNKGFYRVGKAIDGSGVVTGGWGDWIEVDWFSWSNQGAGLALADLDGNNRPELIVFQVDNPPGLNSGFYRIGWNLSAAGVPQDGWGPWVEVPNWGSWEDQGAGFALAALTFGQRPKALIFHVDNPAGLNAGLFRADDLGVDLDAASTLGVWRLLPYFSEVLPVHAALLHTGKVLFFAGSGNNAFRFNSPDFGNEAKGIFTSVVWDFVNNTFDHPPTLRKGGAGSRPIDFFCCGHCCLPDGRIVVAGGTDKYDTDIVNGQMQPDPKGFFGSKDALIFDPAAGNPATGEWILIKPMAHGRWYPTIIMLSDGSVLATSGLDEAGVGPGTAAQLERNSAPSTAAWTGGRNFNLPLYPHLFLLANGQLFYSGGKMDTQGPSDPLVFDPVNAATPTVLVGGLADNGLCNQSASVILPPAQDQRVMIMGGGPEDEGDATTRVAFVDLKAKPPTYVTVAPMNKERIHVNAVLLPDRTVLATGGAINREAKLGGALTRAPNASRGRRRSTTRMWVRPGPGSSSHRPRSRDSTTQSRCSFPTAASLPPAATRTRARRFHGCRPISSRRSAWKSTRPPTSFKVRAPRSTTRRSRSHTAPRSRSRRSRPRTSRR